MIPVSNRKETVCMQRFELMASMMCADYGHLEEEVQRSMVSHVCTV